MVVLVKVVVMVVVEMLELLKEWLVEGPPLPPVELEKVVVEEEEEGEVVVA